MDLSVIPQTMPLFFIATPNIWRNQSFAVRLSLIDPIASDAPTDTIGKCDATISAESALSTTIYSDASADWKKEPYKSYQYIGHIITKVQKRPVDNSIS